MDGIVIGASRRVLGIGLAWAVLWLAFWTILLGIVGILDPDSIDPGEGPLGMAAILGPMGLLTGAAFGILLSIWGRGRSVIDLSLSRVTGWGMLGTAIVQTGYLGHGDAGLAANLMMALLFAVFGGIVTMVWLVIARRWSPGRLTRPVCERSPPRDSPRTRDRAHARVLERVCREPRHRLAPDAPGRSNGAVVDQGDRSRADVAPAAVR